MNEENKPVEGAIADESQANTEQTAPLSAEETATKEAEVVQGPFQVEVTFAEGTTKEDQEAFAPTVQELMKMSNEADTDGSFPKHVHAITIRRI